MQRVTRSRSALLFTTCVKTYQMKKEVWKDIPNYEGYYQVSDLGNVRSLRTGKSLKKFNHRYGYYMVNFSVNGIRKGFSVHQLVALAFMQHSPNGHKLVVDHINNNPKDNRLENLQLISTRENSSKDRKNGTSKYVGVSFVKSRGKYKARIKVNGKLIHLGYFDCELEAKNKYDNYLSALPDSRKTK